MKTAGLSKKLCLKTVPLQGSEPLPRHRVFFCMAKTSRTEGNFRHTKNARHISGHKFKQWQEDSGVQFSSGYAGASENARPCCQIVLLPFGCVRFHLLFRSSTIRVHSLITGLSSLPENKIAYLSAQPGSHFIIHLK